MHRNNQKDQRLYIFTNSANLKTIRSAKIYLVKKYDYGISQLYE